MNLSDGTLSTIAAFLSEIGLPVEIGEIQQPTFLPGIHVESGILRVDPARLSWPGDLLHEAGHLALLTEQQRKQVDRRRGRRWGRRDSAQSPGRTPRPFICNSIPASFSTSTVTTAAARASCENFAAGRYIGLPMLQWRGLTLDEKNARASGVKPYPHMLRWLRVE